MRGKVTDIVYLGKKGGRRALSGGAYEITFQHSRERGDLHNFLFINPRTQKVKAESAKQGMAYLLRYNY